MIKCNTTELTRFFSQTYNFVLITICTYFAIQTRNFGGAFDEAKWIAYSMYGNWIIGITFAAVHYGNLKNYAIQRVALSISTSFSGYLFLIFIFMPKINIIIFKPEKNVKCDDTEELECSAENSFPHSLIEDMSKPTETKCLPPIKEEGEETDVNLIKRATSADDIKMDDKRESTSIPLEQKLMETEVIVHVPTEQKIITDAVESKKELPNLRT